jgi:hypothetical protein
MNANVIELIIIAYTGDIASYLAQTIPRNVNSSKNAGINAYARIRYTISPNESAYFAVKTSYRLNAIL